MAGVSQPILDSSALTSAPGHKVHKEPRTKVFIWINKPVLSHITIYLEDDEHKAVNVNAETINFTCQLLKI